MKLYKMKYIFLVMQYTKKFMGVQSNQHKAAVHNVYKIIKNKIDDRFNVVGMNKKIKLRRD